MRFPVQILRLLTQLCLHFGLLLAALACSLKVSAAPLALHDALSEVENSPGVKRARASSDEASWKRVEGFSGLLPSLTLSGSHLLNEKWLYTDVSFGGAPTSVPAIIPYTTYGLGLQWTVFDGFSNINRWQAMKSLERAEKHDFDWTRFQVQREVIQRFYRALSSQVLRDVAAQSVRTLEDHLNDVRLYKRSGISTKFDVLRVEVQLNEAKTELMNATDTFATNLLRLNEILGRESNLDKPEELKGELPVLSAKMAEGVTPVNDKKLDLVAQGERVEALGKMSRAQGAYWVPKIQLQGSYQKYNNRTESMSDADNYREAYTVSLAASWTFDGIVGPIARDRQAVAQKTQAEQALRLSRIKATNDFDVMKRRFLYFTSVYQMRSGDIDRASEAVRLAKEGRRVGTRTNTELLDAELELFRARAARVNAQIGAIEALTNLELVTGRELFQF